MALCREIRRAWPSREHIPLTPQQRGRRRCLGGFAYAITRPPTLACAVTFRSGPPGVLEEMLTTRSSRARASRTQDAIRSSRSAICSVSNVRKKPSRERLRIKLNARLVAIPARSTVSTASSALATVSSGPTRTFAFLVRGNASHALHPAIPAEPVPAPDCH